MRARRSKKITQEQLAESISEPVAAIAMAESGKIATGNQKLITKIENALGIRLVKSDEIQRTNNEIKRPVEVPRELSFDSSSAKTLTISNLQKIKKQKEARILKENEEKNYSVSPSFVEGINKVENYDYLNESIVLDEKLENKVLNESKEEIKLELESITLTEILKVYLNKDSAVTFVAWKRNHPTEKPVIVVKTKGKTAKKAINDAIGAITKDLDKIQADFKKLK